ncbi:MAG: NAD-dependent epimerase/dehydratase family protein [Burkholderiales bacterium]|jgi:UDP-glucuronate 4-epimerase|nr:NAD-dependent epimerase/dehydratase family protein [Burkholderiales bacterium]
MNVAFPRLSSNDHVLVTGVAGFIGMHVAQRLCRDDVQVTGVDNFDPYYDIRLKEARIANLMQYKNITLFRRDLADEKTALSLFHNNSFTHVIHLAAQPGVRYSLQNPSAYLRNNVVAFGHLLEGCRYQKIHHLVYASSSSVYGANHTLPFSENQFVDHSLSLYAATKKANELMAHSYSHLYRLPSTGLRFFTVYGPWGRPDMSPMLFADAILNKRPIKVFNHGKMRRDFTFIDDIVEGVVRIAAIPPGNDSVSDAPYSIYNIGNHTPVELETFIDILAELLGKSAVREYLPMQQGDMKETYADVSRLAAVTGFVPNTSLKDGLRQFTDWFKSWQTTCGKSR